MTGLGARLCPPVRSKFHHRVGVLGDGDGYVPRVAELAMMPSPQLLQQKSYEETRSDKAETNNNSIHIVY